MSPMVLFIFVVIGLCQLAKLAKNNPADTVRAMSFIRQILGK